MKSFLLCRDDKIRTCDPTPPRRVRYRAALHPEIQEAKVMAKLNNTKLSAYPFGIIKSQYLL